MQQRTDTAEDIGHIQLYLEYKAQLTLLYQQDKLNEQQMNVVKDISRYLAGKKNLRNKKKLGQPEKLLPQDILFRALNLVLDLFDLIDNIKSKNGLYMLPAYIFHHHDSDDEEYEENSDESVVSHSDDSVSESESDTEITFEPVLPSRSASVSPSRYRFINGARLTENQPVTQAASSAKADALAIKYEQLIRRCERR